MAELSESIIARSLWLKWGMGANCAAPNIKLYPFESDLLVLRNTGYVIEYEIKLSVSDFRADSKKSHRVLTGTEHNGTFIKELYGTVTRHDWLRMGAGPNRFYYVVSDSIMDKLDVPDWAGVIGCWPTRSKDRCGVAIRKSPKLLHRKKAGDQVQKKILQSLYYRYWLNFAHIDRS